MDPRSWRSRSVSSWLSLLMLSEFALPAEKETPPPGGKREEKEEEDAISGRMRRSKRRRQYSLSRRALSNALTSVSPFTLNAHTAARLVSISPSSKRSFTAAMVCRTHHAVITSINGHPIKNAWQDLV